MKYRRVGIHGEGGAGQAETAVVRESLTALSIWRIDLAFSATPPPAACPTKASAMSSNPAPVLRKKCFTPVARRGRRLIRQRSTVVTPLLSLLAWGETGASRESKRRTATQVGHAPSKYKKARFSKRNGRSAVSADSMSEECMAWFKKSLDHWPRFIRKMPELGPLRSLEMRSCRN